MRRLDRRNFLQLSAGLCLASTLPLGASRSVAAENAAARSDEFVAKYLTNVVKLELEVGATQPFSAIHVSDSHFCFADERNDERKLKLAESRGRYFANGEKCFDAALALAQKKNALFLHTGDLIDFVSEQNLDVVKAKFDETVGAPDRFVSAGNHEYSLYVGEAKEDAAYKAQSYDRVQVAFPNDLTIASKVVNGVNFVAFDDVYYYATPEIFAAFKKEVEKGLPIVAMCHVPLYTPELFDVAIGKNAACAYLAGVPDERAKDFEPGRFQQQRADETTFEFIAWLREQPLLKAILCGHLHYFWSGKFSETATQAVVGGNYQGAAYEISFR